MATLQEQLDWESYHKEMGVQRLTSALDKAQDSGRITDTPLGNVVLRKYIKELSHVIAKDITTNLAKPGVAKKAVPLLFALDIDSVALVTLNTIVDMVSSAEHNDRHVPLTSLAYALGKNLYAELALAKFQDISPDLYDTLVHDMQRRLSRDLDYRLTVFKLQAQKEGIELPMWTRTQRVLVGTYLINILSSPDFGLELLEMYVTRNGNKTYNNIRHTEKVTELFNIIRVNLLDRVALAAPCLVPPQNWTGEPNVGGFHGRLKTKAPRWYKGPSGFSDIYETHGADLRVALASLNAHQSVAWKVNPFIYSLLLNMSKTGFAIKDEVEFTTAHEKLKPEKPAYLEKAELSQREQDDFAEWKVKRRAWYIEANRIGRVEARTFAALEAAERLLETEEFFYVNQKDYRGRTYSVSGALNPQGSDVQKALLHAAYGERIEDSEQLWWFKLSIAAKYGIDKLAPDACVQWVDDNHANIIAAATSPLQRDAFNWWCDADKPMQFIAVCDEYRRYCEDPVNFKAHIAVAMDGSCNGLQNYSALLRDEVGGRSTNLIQSDTGIPEDIYTDVAKAAYKRLLRMPDCSYKRAWKDLIVNRAITKKPVMTKVYNSKFVTCRDAVIEYCKKNGFFVGEEWEAADYAAKLVWKAIGDVVVKAAEAMDWLCKVSSQVMKEGADYILIRAPNGMLVVQEYNKYETERIETKIGKRIQITVQSDSLKGPNKIKHRNSFPPNFIHCVDGSHLDFVSVRMGELVKGIFLHFVHDDFGVLPKYAPLLAKVIREEFVKMHENYSLDALKEFYPFIDNPPERGNLNIRDVLDSINFFR